MLTRLTIISKTIYQISIHGATTGYYAMPPHINWFIILEIIPQEAK